MNGTPHNDTKARKTAQRDVLKVQNPRTPPDPARQSAITKRAAQMPKSCRANYLKATRGQAAPRVAIKAFCMECVGWQRPEVEHCTAVACPLWAYRPLGGGSEKETRTPAGNYAASAGAIINERIIT